jgi:hypothetical protein
MAYQTTNHSFRMVGFVHAAPLLAAASANGTAEVSSGQTSEPKTAKTNISLAKAFRHSREKAAKQQE